MDGVLYLRVKDPYKVHFLHVTCNLCIGGRATDKLLTNWVLYPQDLKLGKRELELGILFMQNISRSGRSINYV